jgi:uncharacterized protein YdeI (YjbR/CyaY-like superfamily)
MVRNKRVDVYVKKEVRWQDEFIELREIALKTGLTEDMKWGHPCYTLNGGNVFLIHGFKEYCAILFMKGALMKDPKKILIQQTANVQSARQFRFKNLKEITKQKAAIKAFMNEAIKIEEVGLKVEMKKPTEIVIPEDIAKYMKKMSGLTAAFKKLTPGRQRAYVLHFNSAKQDSTRKSRVEKCAPAILKGKGLNE